MLKFINALITLFGLSSLFNLWQPNPPDADDEDGEPAEPDPMESEPESPAQPEPSGQDEPENPEPIRHKFTIGLDEHTSVAITVEVTSKDPNTSIDVQAVPLRSGTPPASMPAVLQPAAAPPPAQAISAEQPSASADVQPQPVPQLPPKPVKPKKERKPGVPLKERWARITAWWEARNEAMGGRLPQMLLWGALIIYAAVRLIGLQYFPIYFFTDEAVQTNFAADFLRDNFHSREGEFFPTYFRLYTTWNLNFSVYIQMLPYVFFGRAIWATRGIIVLTGILGAYLIALILRDVLKINHWWLGVLVFSMIPAWFLHSRTAFETVLMTPMYIGFIYFYLLYRQGDTKKLYWAVTLGSMAFYTYSAGRAIVPITGLLLLLSDFRYHWENRKVGFRALGLILIFILPQIRFMRAHPDAYTEQLANLGSYTLQPIPFSDKVRIFFSNYAYALSPGYWFIHNDHDLVRHQMGPIPHIFTWMLPFFVIGLIEVIRKLRQTEWRTLFFVLLAAPTGAALVQIGITRTLLVVFPAALLITIGIVSAVNWLGKRYPILNATLAAVTLFAFLGLSNIVLLTRALSEGPTWSDNYTLDGMQWGAPSLFEEVDKFVADHPDVEIVMSPNWANGTEQMVDFYYSGQPWPFRLGEVFGEANDPNTDITNTVFITLPREYQQLLDDPKYKDIQVLQIINYPNGQPGFYFLTLDRVANVEQLLEEEAASLTEMVDAEVVYNGELVQVRHSVLDMGLIDHAFDDDPNSLNRTGGANPYVIELTFPSEHTFTGVDLITGGGRVEVTVEVYENGSDDPRDFVIDHDGGVQNPLTSLAFGDALTTNRVIIYIRSLDSAGPTNVHLWEVTFIEE